MNYIPSQTTNEYDNASGTNPSLITAGLPSGTIMTSRLIQPSPTIKQNHHFNQNRANHTQSINISNSLQNKNSQCTIPSYRTISDTYLNLSRKDIDDIMTALHTLAQYVQNDIDNESSREVIPIDDDDEDHHLTTLYSKSTNHTLKSSTEANSSFHYYPRYSIRSRRHSLSSDCCLNHHHHHIKHHLNLVKEFQHDLYAMRRKQERRIFRQLEYQQRYFTHHNPSNYPSYSSNAILYTSTCKSNTRSKQIYHYSQHRQSTIKIASEDQYQQSIKKKLSSSISLSSYILDKLIYIDQKEPISTIQILPQQAQTLEILQNNYLHSLMSIDSLNTKDIFITPIIPCYLQKINHNQTFGIGDQLNLNKIDVATQWSLQTSTPKCIEMDVFKSNSFLKSQDEENHLKLPIKRKNSTILTELSQSITTIATNNSTNNKPLISKPSSFINNSLPVNDPCNIETNEMCLEKSELIINVKHELTKSETERFLTTLNIPTCKCSTMKQKPINTNAKHLSIDDNITCISLNNNSSISSFSSSNKKRTKPISIKLSSKRPRHHTSKSSKNNQTIKRSRPYCRTQSNNRSMTIIPSYKPPTDLKQDSSFDFFDIDTTFSDTYDRLFTTSEKSS